METKPKAAAVCPICTRERAMNDLTLPYGHYWHSKTDTKQRSSKAGVLASISGAFFRPSFKKKSHHRAKKRERSECHLIESD